MSGTNEQEASEERVVVTDDMLSSAADAAVGAEEVAEEVVEDEVVEEVVAEEVVEEEEEVAEEAVEDEEAEEPVSAADRSRLGRKVKKQDTIIQTLLQRIEGLEGKGATARSEPDPDALEDDDFVKAADIPKLLQAEKEKEQRTRTAYESAYLSKVLEIGTNEGIEDSLQDEIFEEMQKNFNVIHQNIPSVDAEINFGKAHVAVLKRQAAGKPKNPLKGGKSKVAIGVGGGTETKVKAAKPAVKLDSHAAAFIADTGGSVEKAAEILANEHKPHLNFHRG